MSDTPDSRSPEVEKDYPTHFIIKLQHKGQNAYALCARVLIVENDNLVGLSSSDLDRFIEKNPVQAAALLSGVHIPDGMSGKLVAGMSGKLVEGMSGKHLSVSIDGNGNTINLNDVPGAANNP